MSIQFSKILAVGALIAAAAPVLVSRPQQTAGTMKPEETEVWEPIPKVVTPGVNNTAAPSDAIVLFDGKNLDEWVQNRDKSSAKWTVADGVLTVNKAKDSGNIETKRSFKDYQLHIEWKIPENITGSGQARGNSGMFLASTGPAMPGMNYRYWIRL